MKKLLIYTINIIFVYVIICLTGTLFFFWDDLTKHRGYAPYLPISSAIACEFMPPLNGHYIAQTIPKDCQKVILFSGAISHASIESLKLYLAAIQEHPNTLCFNSSGGNIYAARDFAYIIKRFNLNTCLANYYLINDKYHGYSPITLEEGKLVKTRNLSGNGYGGKYQVVGKDKPVSCFSVCPFIFMAGRERYAFGEENIDVKLHHPGHTISIFNGYKAARFYTNLPSFDEYDNPFKQIIDILPDIDKQNMSAIYSRAMSTHYSDFDTVSFQYMREKRLVTN